MYAPGGSNGPPFNRIDTANGPHELIAAALAQAATTQAAAERAKQAAAAAVAATGQGQLPPWMTPSASFGGSPTPKFVLPPDKRPPGLLKASSPSTAKASAGGGKSDSAMQVKTKPELPVKSLRVGDDADTIEIEAEDGDDTPVPAKSHTLPNMSADADTPVVISEDCPSLGSAAHGTGTCTPCAWFWKPDSCLNAKDCRYCHICPEGELKKRKKQKVAKMRLGLVTPKSGASPTAQMLNLSSLI